MSDNMTAAEIKQQQLAALGPSLGPLCYALYNELVWLHAKWLEYRKLYATSPERIEVLNRTGEFLFFVVNEVMWDDVLLHICRLIDPPRQKFDKIKYDNLTLRRLPLYLKDPKVNSKPDPKLQSEIEKLVDLALVQSEFARDHRNRRIAHSELNLALGKAPPLEDSSRQKVEDVLSTFSEILNSVLAHYLVRPVSFREFITASADANTLVFFANYGLVSEHQRMERHRTGRAIPEDNKPFPEV